MAGAGTATYTHVLKANSAADYTALVAKLAGAGIANPLPPTSDFATAVFSATKRTVTLTTKPVPLSWTDAV